VTVCANESKEYKLSRLPFAKRINRVLDSKYFLAVVALITVLSNLLEMELLLYGFAGVSMLYLGLFGTDFRLLIPLFIHCYISPSMKNNPGMNETTVFSAGSGVAILVIAGVALLSFVVRCIVDKEIGFSRLKEKHSLLIGLSVLGVAFLLSGIGSAGYLDVARRNAVFAAVQLAAFLGPYLIISIGVRWDKIDRDYLATVGLLMGLVVGVEVLNVYRIAEVIQPDGSVLRARIFLGWGNYNNMASIIAMAVPFAFYFIYLGKHVILNNVLAALLCVFAVMTCSRAGILGTCAIYLFSALIVLIGARKKRARISALVGVIVALGVLIAAFFLLREFLAAAFNTGLQSNERLELYKAGLDSFVQYPVFGFTFFRLNALVEAGAEGSWIFSSVSDFNAFFPGRWHNTFVQMLASCGVVGLLSYAFHRYQTIRLVLRKPNAIKTFAAISIGVLLALCMVDSHLFNVGPALFYSSALAFMEHKKVEEPITASPGNAPKIDEENAEDGAEEKNEENYEE